jgi:putative endonuclease
MKPETKTDNRTKKRKIGDVGENIACKFLVKRGFEIIEQNYSKKWGEIDIIAKKTNKLHFIEVKSVSHLPVSYETDNYNPEDNLHPWKLQRLSRAIQTYLLGYKGNRDVSCQPGNSTGETDWQFDVMVVYLDLKSMEAKVNYMEDIIL